MSWQDITNSGLIGLAACLSWLNVRRIYKDKEIEGVSWLPSAFFALWGVWDLYYFPHLGQWFSVCSSTIATGANLSWLYLVFYYKNKKIDK